MDIKNMKAKKCLINARIIGDDYGVQFVFSVYINPLNSAARAMLKDITSFFQLVGGEKN